MSKDSSDHKIVFHASSTGRLFIKGEEFFKASKIKLMLERLRESSIYKHIKEEQQTNLSAR